MKLREIARIVFEGSDPTKWDWSRSARHCGFERFGSTDGGEGVFRAVQVRICNEARHHTA